MSLRFSKSTLAKNEIFNGGNLMAMNYDKYTELRSGDSTIFGYGLQRRTNQLLKLFLHVIKDGDIKKAKVIDFGCSDDHMINQIKGSFYDCIESIKGIDIFPHGKPVSDDGKTEFITINLTKDLPLPFESESQNVLVQSAFFKHHPRPMEMLSECHRILDKGGYIIILDPSMWVVRLGFLLNYFDRKYTKNPWSYKSVSKMISTLGLENNMEIILYEKYWVAPNSFLYKSGIEKIIPDFLIQIFGLHQSIIIKKL